VEESLGVFINAGYSLSSSMRAMDGTFGMKWRFLEAGAQYQDDKLDPPSLFFTGLIYSPDRNVDLDIGAKFSLNDAQANCQISVGPTWRFNSVALSTGIT
jgi:hypothetical protein